MSSNTLEQKWVKNEFINQGAAQTCTVPLSGSENINLSGGSALKRLYKCEQDHLALPAQL